MTTRALWHDVSQHNRRARLRDALQQIGSRAAYPEKLLTVLPGRGKIAYSQQQRKTAVSALSPRWLPHIIVVLLVAFVFIGEQHMSWSHQAAAPRQISLAMTIPLNNQLDMADTLSQAVPFAIEEGSQTPPVFNALSMEPLAPTLSNPSNERIPAFRAEPHHMAEGETLGEVAQRYGISLNSLVWANHLYNGDVLMPGQELRIPRLSGIPYIIQEGDTLDSIATFAGVPAELIVAFESNDLQMDEPLPVRREIFIPGSERPLPSSLLAARGNEVGIASIAAQQAGIVRSEQTNMRQGPDTVYERVAQVAAGRRAALLARHADWLQVDIGGATGWIRADMLDLPAGIVETLPETDNFPPPPPTWVWPTHGAFTSAYGPRWGGFHNGIDIANGAGTPIVAARAGRVTQAGWCSGYGYCVKIQHDSGFSTVYGHLLSQPVVAAGNTVGVGELIGVMGSTYDVSGGGYSTGNHLHFEIRVNGRAVNPLSFLP
jgi:murein DD-endopeptidase MepM/ murein hydrolase activator NlpD